MKRLFGIYGASGFGRELLTFVRNPVREKGGVLFFIDDMLAGSMKNGIQILTYNDFMKEDGSDRSICIGIGDAVIRRKLSEKCAQDSIRSWSISATNVFIGDEVIIGEGSVLCPFVTITCNATIGKFFHANIYSYVAHDCIIGDYVTFAPGVKCNGNVVIENGAYIGTGAILKQGTPDNPLIIGEGAIIGMGAVVTKSVPAGAVMVGNPAKPLIK